MKVNDFLDFPVPEPQYKIPITKSAEEPYLLYTAFNNAPQPFWPIESTYDYGNVWLLGHHIFLKGLNM